MLRAQQATAAGDPAELAVPVDDVSTFQISCIQSIDRNCIITTINSLV